MATWRILRLPPYISLHQVALEEDLVVFVLVRFFVLPFLRMAILSLFRLRMAKSYDVSYVVAILSLDVK